MNRKSSVLRFVLLSFAVAWLSACASAPSSKPVNTTQVGFVEEGIASFYANKYQFRTTANGERFNQFASTAAHKTLPFNSRVRVTNLDNGKSVIVRINDRGPFIEGRIIDLSRSSFSEIADTSAGLARVRIEVVP
ncbi:septal ring lytic transglycosylase RlpA family protein [Aliidiomarina haloalkalitolerans]|uniref:Endolytic peptidoglycan transglycosylase RlpA n=1 Tax=Aliidiomarina haloalkalitolerans TaxID=859059 RepID=A0A432VXU9_9GAMM|nr:septal ring lytic transglycosylase RlpA family protein [Aliidiomarina haloalkalitolerans]RUO21504.1 septal ring lytic transglycosylase RlpA family lipoprotein [Aliidiomarina haloalkalitolerans]